METCYRHPNRETGVSCSSCGRPICPDCMTPTPVGMRCPECSRQRTKVRTARTLQAGGVEVTRVLIGINVLAWIAELSSGGFGGNVYVHGALFGPSVADGDYWRLITGGFLHVPNAGTGIIHIGFNMYLLWVLGQMLEPALGPVRFGALYFTSLLAGSFGALLVNPNVPTVGASGAVFGLMGAAFVELRARGIDPFQAGIGGLIVINLLFSFVFSNISVGGHIGGLVGGVLATLALQAGDRMRSRVVGLAGCVVLSAVAVVAGIAAA
jgi:membrane associated rhomboid family serine protease